MTLVELAAVAPILLTAGAAAFQPALAAGLPLGAATMGRRAATIDGVLQPLYRAIAGTRHEIKKLGSVRARPWPPAQARESSVQSHRGWRRRRP